MSTSHTGRIAWFDALRGFALIGIFVANLPGLSGYLFLSPDARAALSFDAGAGVVSMLSYVLVEAKFYSVFSFLFGVGLALQIGDAPRLRRRLGVLFLIGLAHAWLVWWGDILCMYALLGFIVVALRPSPAFALRLGIALLAAPVLVYFVFVLFGTQDPLSLSSGASSEPPPILSAPANGSPLEVMQSNMLISVGVVVRRVMRFQLLRILGMFLIGYWFVLTLRNEAGEATRARLLRWIKLGFFVGLPLNIVYWAFGGGDALFPAQPGMLIGVAAASLGIPLLALAYVGVFGLYWNGDAGSWLVAAGRMPLTNYLMQSVLGVSIFYGFAGGLWGELGRLQVLLLGLVISMLQLAASAWWLQRHESGPMEALWRRLAGARPGTPVLER